MYCKIFPAKIDFLYEMLEFINSYGVSQHLAGTSLDHIHLAAEEALVNIINYAYPKEQKGVIEICCEESNPSGIKIIIKDQGVPFNPIENLPSNSTPSILTEKPNESLGGYGISLYVGLMDQVEYQRVHDGNILSMTKYHHSIS